MSAQIEVQLNIFALAKLGKTEAEAGNEWVGFKCAQGEGGTPELWPLSEWSE